MLLFSAARAQIVAELIKPALAAGKTVVCDRYADSTLAYQGYGQGGDLATLRLLLDFATGHLKPDLTLLLDIDASLGLQRRQKGGGEWNRLDANTLAYHERVRRGYLQMAREEPERWVVVDASLPPEELQARLRAIVMQRLQNRSHASHR